MGFTRISGVVLIQSSKLREPSQVELSPLIHFSLFLTPSTCLQTHQLQPKREKEGNQVVSHDQKSELYLNSPLADPSGLSSFKLLFLKIAPVLNTTGNIVDFTIRKYIYDVPNSRGHFF